jgi:protein gp37
MNKTKIQWTELTWNPVTGCSRISLGCLNCYAATMAKRLKAMGNPRYKNEFNVTIHEDLFEMPLHIKQSKMIFVNSMSDLFHEDVPDNVIIRLFEIMNLAHWHIFQVLTKRPERLLNMDNQGLLTWSENIWMGTTVEHSDYLQRVNYLNQTNAHIKFLSCEPLLGSLKEINLDNINWVIVGGESGPKSRGIEISWVRELRDLCHEENIPFFFKQWGGFYKKKNGRLLDGITHDEFPEW